jgi:ribosomal protein L18E
MTLIGALSDGYWLELEKTISISASTTLVELLIEVAFESKNPLWKPIAATLFHR